MTKIIKAILRFLFLLVLAVILVLGLCITIFQLPSVQSYFAKKVIDFVEQRTTHKIEIKEVDIDWLDIAVIKGVELYDFEGAPMIVANEVVVNFNLFGLLESDSYYIDGIHLDSLALHLYKYNDSTSLNLSVFLDALRKDQAKKPRGIFSSEFYVDQLRFSFDDKRFADTTENILDLRHLDFEFNNLISSNLNIQSGRILVDVESISGEETNCFIKLRNFTSQIEYNQRELILNELYAKTDDSEFRDQLTLSYSQPSNLVYFSDSVNLKINLHDARIGAKDITKIRNVNWSEDLTMNGTIKGVLSDLQYSDAKVKLDDGSSFEGIVYLKGLPEIRNTFIDLRVEQASLNEALIRNYSDNTVFNIGNVGFKGNLIGFLNDFVAAGVFNTDRGEIRTDINLKLPENIEAARYSGRLILNQFDAGTFINRQNILGDVNFNGEIRGRGLTKSSADVRVSAEIKNTDILGHRFDYAQSTGRFKSNFFSGSINVQDSSLSLSGIAEIDFQQKAELINVDFDIKKADLYDFGISQQPLTVSAQIQGEVVELNIDQASGDLTISNISVSQSGQNVSLEEIRLIAKLEEQKSYEIISSDFYTRLTGTFELTELLADIPQTLFEYRDFFLEDYEKTLANYKGSPPRSKYEADLYLDVYNVNHYFDYLGIPIQLSRDFEVEVSFNQRKDANFSFYTSLDSIKYEQRLFLNNSIEVNASKDIDSLGVLALIQVSSDEQQWDVFAPTGGFVLESVWSNNQLDFNFLLEQLNNGNRAEINTNLRLLEDTIRVKMLSSVLKAFEQPWYIDKDNEINITREGVFIENLELSNQDQSVQLSGVYSDSLSTNLNLIFEAFELNNISVVLPRQFEGILTGNARIFTNETEPGLDFDSDLRIVDLVFEDVLVGNLSGQSMWDETDNSLLLDYRLERDNVRTIDVEGTIDPFGERDLALNVDFDRANFKIIEPIFRSLISDLKGYASGNLKFEGSIDNPRAYGTALIDSGEVTINYLNTRYGFNGTANFKNQEISLTRVDVNDRFGNTGVFQGNVTHKNFKNFEVDLSFDHSNFELLNTTKVENSLYYGNAYSTGSLSITGPIENVLISAEVTSAPNTRIYIPLTEFESFGEEDYITFINPSDTTQSDSLIVSTSIKGLSIDFDINITPDAYVELIFDPRTGDIIRGRGQGNLQMLINADGEFQLFGGLEVTEGAYNFTTSIINKEFQIKPGGTLTWFGDPYLGNMDIEATYRQLADPNDWYVSDETATEQKAPVLVVLDMQGPMTTPEINFRLELDEATTTTGVSDQWRGLLSRVNNDQQELKRQVFSLLILRQFSPQNSFVVGGVQQGLGSSVSEFFSNQLSYWLNQVDDNLEVSIDLNSLDSDAFNTFQLRLAYTFLDGRLRVTRGGGVTTVVDENQQFANILGDWSVEYLLTEDGRWRAKLFSRANQSAVNQNLSQTQETGASLQYIRSFDQLKELIGKSRNEETANQTQSSPSTGSQP